MQWWSAEKSASAGFSQRIVLLVLNYGPSTPTCLKSAKGARVSMAELTLAVL